MNAIAGNKWHEALIRQYHLQSDLQCMYKVRNELTVDLQNKVLLRDHRLVLPKSLRSIAVDIAHEGHQGIVKTKQLIRQKVWFPGIDYMVEEKVNACLPCQATTTQTYRSEPLQMSKLPNGSWEEISIDFKELPTGEYLLVILDDYSRFLVVEVVRSTSAKTVIPKLDTVFANFGIPRIVRTDNGPPFNSHDFTEFAKYLGFHHRKIIPLWPQANGEVERVMRNLKKLYRTAVAEGANYKQSLNQYLRNYRATPHSTTGVSPASMNFHHSFKIRLPEIAQKSHMNTKAVRNKDKSQKRKMKANAEKLRPIRSRHIRVGDVVLVKESGILTSSKTPYKTTPYTVTKTNGTMITATQGHHEITRNVSFFKRFKGQSENIPTHSNDYYSDDDTAETQPTTSDTRFNPPRNRQPPAYLRDYVP